MARTASYREKLHALIRKSGDQVQIYNAKRVLKLLDALKKAGTPEGYGFGIKISRGTRLSRTTISNVFSGKTALTSSFVDAVVKAFGVNEAWAEGLNAQTDTPPPQPAGNLASSKSSIKTCENDTYWFKTSIKTSEKGRVRLNISHGRIDSRNALNSESHDLAPAECRALAKILEAAALIAEQATN